MANQRLFGLVRSNVYLFDLGSAKESGAFDVTYLMASFQCMFVAFMP